MRLLEHSANKAKEKRKIKWKSIIKTRWYKKLCVSHDVKGEENDSEWIESKYLDVESESGDCLNYTVSDEPRIKSIDEWLINTFYARWKLDY